MELHARITGTGPPIVLLHGLFGSNENLGGIARTLAESYTVHALDLRNHGQSPHADAMDHATMAGDVVDTMRGLDLPRATMLGHSLGGKIAMELALGDPDKVERLIVLDIAPVAHGHQHDDELEAMQSLDLAAIHARKDADDAMADRLPNPAIRQFLLKNLTRTGDRYRWRIPLGAIAREYADIAAAPATGHYEGPALFIRGGASGYVPDDAMPAIHGRFPSARIETIAGAAHWLHVESPEAVMRLVRGFLDPKYRG